VRLRTSEDLRWAVAGIGGWRQTPPHAAAERSSCAQKDGEDRSREAQRQRGGEWRTDYPYGRIPGLGYSRAVGHTIRHAWALRHS
jgi:hypothetical protein